MDKKNNPLLNILIIIIKITYSIFLFLGLFVGLMYAPYGYNFSFIVILKISLIFSHLVLINISGIKWRFQKIISIINLLFYLMTISYLTILLNENDPNPIVYTFIIFWIILFIESATNIFLLLQNKASK
jgi:hypothetical protein